MRKSQSTYPFRLPERREHANFAAFDKIMKRKGGEPAKSGDLIRD
jgi:hypothetical protein